MKKIALPIKEIFVFILYIIFPILISIFLPGVSDSTNMEIIIRLILEIILVGIYIYLYRNAFSSDLDELGKNKKILRNAILYTFLTIILIGCFNGILLLINEKFIVSPNNILVDKYLKNKSLYMLITIFLLSPIKEEIVFRKIFKDVIPNKIIYIIISTLVCTFVTIGYNISSLIELFAMVPIVLSSVIRAYSYTKTNNIYTPILINVLYSLFVLITRII